MNALKDNLLPLSGMHSLPWTVVSMARITNQESDIIVMAKYMKTLILFTTM